MKICDQQRLESLEEKKAAHMRTCVSEGVANFIAKGDGLANSRDVNPLETIWIIVDKTILKDPTPQNTGRAKRVTTLRLEKCFLDTLWELVHSIPHHLENVRKHKGRHIRYSMLNE